MHTYILITDVLEQFATQGMYRSAQRFLALSIHPLKCSSFEKSHTSMFTCMVSLLHPGAFMKP